MSEYLSRSKETLNLLMAQRDALETEAFAINEDLTSPGPNGEPAAGLKDSLVDAEGFPRADIDVYAVRNKRHRLSVINTDHKAVMKQIEAELRNLHSQELPASISSQTFSKALEVLPAPVISETKLTPNAAEWGSAARLWCSYFSARNRCDEQIPRARASECRAADKTKGGEGAQCARYT
jgi:Nas2 N_terminal domain